MDDLLSKFKENQSSYLDRSDYFKSLDGTGWRKLYNDIEFWGGNISDWLMNMTESVMIEIQEGEDEMRIVQPYNTRNSCIIFIRNLVKVYKPNNYDGTSPINLPITKDQWKAFHNLIAKDILKPNDLVGKTAISPYLLKEDFWKLSPKQIETFVIENV